MSKERMVPSLYDAAEVVSLLRTLLLRLGGHDRCCDKRCCIHHRGQVCPDKRTFCTCGFEEGLARARDFILDAARPPSEEAAKEEP